MVKANQKALRDVIKDPLDVLEHPKLMDIIVQAVQSTGVKGEEKPIKAEILVIVGKKCVNKENISTNLHPEDEAGIGKDHVTEHVMLVVFCKDWIKFDSPSATAITRGQKMIKIKDSKGKEKYVTEDKKITKNSIIYIKDATNEFIESKDCRMLLEGDVDTARTMDGHAVHFKWKKPIVIITTASTSSGTQTIRRLPSLHMDSSTQQTDRIMKWNLDKKCDILDRRKKKDKNIGLMNNIRKSFHLLEEVYVDLSDVKNYIEEKQTKNRSVMMRTLSNRLYDFVCFHATLYQKKRKHIGTTGGCSIIKATIEDVDEGFDTFTYIYGFEKVDVSILNSRQKNLLRRFIKHPNRGYSITQVEGWKESGDTTKPTVTKDLRTLVKEIKEMRVDDDFPATYGYYDIMLQKEIPDVLSDNL